MELEELRDHIGPGPSDDVLTKLLTAADEAIVERYGPVSDEISESLSPFGSLIFLSRRAQSVTSVLEGLVLLDYEQYELVGTGRRLRRLNDDGDPMYWRASIEVTYTPYSNEAERDRVTIALVELDLNNAPGMQGANVGAWQEQYANNSAWNYAKERDAILDSMRQPTRGVW